MIFAILPLLLSSTLAAPSIYSGVGVLGPSYHAPLVPVATVQHPDQSSYTLSNVESHTGSVKQQTAVEKDGLGGHTIRHSAQSSNVDPHSGQTDVKHDQHEFHINPYYGQAQAHINNAEGSLNPALGKAGFVQKIHEAKIAPGHASVADVSDTAAVSPHSSAASRDVNAARTDVVHDGIAKNAHSSHKSYVNAPGFGANSKVAESNHRSFDGPGYGNLHVDNKAADESYDALGHASANEEGYKLDQAYDARVNLGASNELQYSRHAAHDPYGNYGAVTQTRQASQGGQLVPVVHPKEAVYVAQPKEAVYIPQAVVAKEVVQGPIVYNEPAPVVQNVAPAVYDAPESYGYVQEVSPIAYQKEVPYVYEEPLPVSYRKQASLVYGGQAPVAYNKHSSISYEPSVVYKQPVVYGVPSNRRYYHRY